MAVILSEDRVIAIQRSFGSTSSRSLSLYRGLTQDYAAIYRSQPNIKICVGFLARNIGQMAIHIFRRISDNDRARLADHQMDTVLEKPNPYMTGFRFRDTLVNDLGIWGNSLFLKIRPRQDIGVPVALVWVPWRMVTPDPGSSDSWIFPSEYLIQGNRGRLTVTPEQVLHFRFYHPDDGRVGVSPIESLRRVLAEEAAAGDYRESFWRNAARVPGIIERPKNAKWSDPARDRFKESWAARWSGDEAGGTPILEDDMKWKDTGFDAQSSQYIEARKLSREECAAAYFIQPPMVGVLEHATFSNIDEQHKMTYQDTLAPYLKMITDDADLQLLPEFADVDRVYSEFNIAEKMKGSFEQQADALTKLTGTPILAANEARGKLNLNRIDDPAFDVPVKPLNVLFGGGTPPVPAAAPPKSRGFKAIVSAGLVETHRAKALEVLQDFFTRQGESVKAKAGVKATPSIDGVWDTDRWDRELKDELFGLSTLTAQAFGDEVAARFDGEYDVEFMGLPYLENNSRIAAESINLHTRAAVEAALAGEEVSADLIHVFDLAIDSRAPMLAVDRTTSTGNFGQIEAARATGRPSKSWIVTSANPRPSHASMAGETVDIDELFSIGGMWPGDPDLPTGELAGCTCLVDFA